MSRTSRQRSVVLPNSLPRQSCSGKKRAGPLAVTCWGRCNGPARVQGARRYRARVEEPDEVEFPPLADLSDVPLSELVGQDMPVLARVVRDLDTEGGAYAAFGSAIG